MRKLLFILVATCLLVSVAQSGLTITPTGGGGTIPNTTNLLIGGASNTAANSTIAPSNLPLLNAANTYSGANLQTFSNNVIVTGSGSGSNITYFKTGTLTPVTAGVTWTGYFTGNGTYNRVGIDGQNPAFELIESGTRKWVIASAVGDFSLYDSTGSGYAFIASAGTGNIRFYHTMRIDGIVSTGAAAPTIASAATIAPTTQIVFISGTAAIATITAPAPISTGGGTITLIPTGIFTTTTGGNIALASTAVVSKAMTMTFDVTTTKWYPSY